jgi:hypothetical protein
MTPSQAGAMLGPPVRKEAPLTIHAELRCMQCGYRISSFEAVPLCPMCRSSEWIPVAWRPFSRSVRGAEAPLEQIPAVRQRR